jgi:hypothetical protein
MCGTHMDSYDIHMGPTFRWDPHILFVGPTIKILCFLIFVSGKDLNNNF